MFYFRLPVSTRLLLALGIALCVLPGCGGGNSAAGFLAISRSGGGPIALTLALNNEEIPLAYNLRVPPDPRQPLVITANGIPLQLGIDYSLDPAMPAVLHIITKFPPSASDQVYSTTVQINYTAPATIMETFHYSHGSLPALTLAQPVDFTEPVAVEYAAASIEAIYIEPVSNQNYTILTTSPSVFRVKKPFASDGQLSVTYTPKAFPGG